MSVMPSPKLLPVQPNLEWDDVSVEEIQDLVRKVEEFYAERGNPRVNAIWLADTFLDRLYNDLDYYANIEGFKGYGKSNLLLLLAILQCRYSGLWRNKATGKIVKVLPRKKPLSPEWEHIKCGFSFRQNMSFMDNSEDIKAKYYSLDRYMPFGIDEGSKNLHKYGWQSKLQFMLVKMSDTERYQNKSFFVCFPNFQELNTTFRNQRIMMRLYLYARSTTKQYSSCIISIRDINRYVLDPWHTDENAKSFEHLLRRVPAAMRGADHILYAEKKMKGYAGSFDVPSIKHLAPRIWDIYMKYKIKNAKESAVEEQNAETTSKRVEQYKKAMQKVVSLLREKQPDLSVKHLAMITGFSPSTVQDFFVNEKVQNVAQELNK